MNINSEIFHLLGIDRKLRLFFPFSEFFDLFLAPNTNRFVRTPPKIDGHSHLDSYLPNKLELKGNNL